MTNLLSHDQTGLAPWSPGAPIVFEPFRHSYTYYISSKPHEHFRVYEKDFLVTGAELSILGQRKAKQIRGAMRYLELDAFECSDPSTSLPPPHTTPQGLLGIRNPAIHSDPLLFTTRLYAYNHRSFSAPPGLSTTQNQVTNATAGPSTTAPAGPPTAPAGPAASAPPASSAPAPIRPSTTISTEPSAVTPIVPLTVAPAGPPTGTPAGSSATASTGPPRCTSKIPLARSRIPIPTKKLVKPTNLPALGHNEIAVAPAAPRESKITSKRKYLSGSEQSEDDEPVRHKRHRPAASTFSTLPAQSYAGMPAINLVTPASQHAEKPRIKGSAWSDAEENMCITLLRNIKEAGLVSNVQKLWPIVEANMKSQGFDRSASAIKNHWNRHLRAKSGFDERANPRPDALRTGALDGTKVGRLPGKQKPAQKTPAMPSTAGKYAPGTLASQQPAAISSFAAPAGLNAGNVIDLTGDDDDVDAAGEPDYSYYFG